MVRGTLRRWRKPPPMLVFMRAVMLPAAALIIASVFWLTHIQRDQMIDAAIQRDYQHTLKIAEKGIVERAYETSERASLQFPDVDHPEELDAFLTTHPECGSLIWPVFCRVVAVLTLTRQEWPRKLIATCAICSR
jgi:hypothetical protein